MKKVKSGWGGERKGAGRPATGKDPLVCIRMPEKLVAAIDKAAEKEGVSRSEKIRELIEKAL
ncbi:MAG: CopG family transcriptional regulator [Xanthobacteraceae bacterium]|nr:CopG family transcriptional regulator [Xanthobacteraceae bacterium]MBX3547759.1 CopG family transcriptional regulator [Xanthobacteraceae bacterium]